MSQPGQLGHIDSRNKRDRDTRVLGQLLIPLSDHLSQRCVVCRGSQTGLSAWLIQDDDGKPLGTFGLRSRFDKARRAAGVEFQFRDIRAKAATDTGDLAHSQKLLGHRNREMTEHYVRSRVGERVQPLR